jgi:tetratricopeptide (TPR) repeat protein
LTGSTKQPPFFEKAISQNVDGSELRFERYTVAFLQKDTAAMQEQIAAISGKPDREELVLQVQAEVEAYYGHLGSARAALKKAGESAGPGDASEGAATWKAYQSVRQAEVGDAELARKMATEALSQSNGLDVQELAALALARAGDAAQAQKLADKLNQEFPLHTLVQRYWLPTIRAAIALDKKNPREAIEALRAAAPYELAEVSYQGLYPVYMRGIAFLAAGQGAEAAGEFRKILEHRGIMCYRAISPLSQLQLARAEAMTGDKSAASSQYQDFLALWKDGDSDIPILKQARTEYSQLIAR